MRFWFKRSFAPIVVLAALSACGDKPATMEDLHTRDVTLPGGQVIQAESMVDATDMLRGMMFRTSLAADHGMLFLHRGPGNYSYWMYRTLIPLDIIWMDSSKRIVEIVPNAQPCKTEASQCPKYGGHELAQYVLELGGGMAQKYNLRVGDYINF
jgi:uncharacterized membrane protein (UPF0127 family)